MRYKKFLLEKEPYIPTNGNEGLNVVSNNISEEEAMKNVENYNMIFGIYLTVTELFDCQNIMMCASGASIFFSIPQKGWKEYTKSGPEIESPKLDREKLQKATPNKVAGAIIDIFLDRKKWNNKVFSKELKF